jgi:hypothetical protein
MGRDRTAADGTGDRCGYNLPRVFDNVMIPITIYHGGTVETVYIPDELADVPLHELARNGLIFKEKK